MLCALRFHEHDQSKAILSHLRTPREQLAAHNRTVGSKLSTLISNLFYQEFSEGTYTSGGDYKLKMISSSSPGFELQRLKRQSLHPLQKLLDDLYSLLNEHYAALDVASLARYKVQETETGDATVPVFEFKTPQSLATRLSRSTTSIPLMKSTSLDRHKRLVTWNKPGDPRLVLDSHDAMIRIFDALWSQNADDRQFCLGDKTEDQLYGLTQKVDLPPTQASGFSSSKRKSDESQSQRSAKQSRVEGSSTGTLDVIGEEDRQAAS